MSLTLGWLSPASYLPWPSPAGAPCLPAPRPPPLPPSPPRGSSRPPTDQQVPAKPASGERRSPPLYHHDPSRSHHDALCPPPPPEVGAAPTPPPPARPPDSHTSPRAPTNPPPGSPQNVLACKPVDDKQHIAEKPEAVMRWVMQVVPRGALVLDPFMGSGTTLFAAKSLGCPSIGIDVDERYCEIAARRCSQEVLDAWRRWRVRGEDRERPP